MRIDYSITVKKFWTSIILSNRKQKISKIAPSTTLITIVTRMMSDFTLETKVLREQSKKDMTSWRRRGSAARGNKRNAKIFFRIFQWSKNRKRR